jgi:hypothetical protein
MIPSKILARLVHYAPSALRLRAKPGPRCVLATRIGIDVLARFGLAAAPLQVIVEVANAAYVEWVTDGAPGGDDQQRARGVWLVSNDPVKRRRHGELPRQGPLVTAPWDGHLAIDTCGHLVDLDAQQFARPTRGICPPPALALPWDGHATGCDLPQGGALFYQPWPIDFPIEDYRDAPDWRCDIRDIVDALTRAIRKGSHDDRRRHRSAARGFAE